MGSTVLLTFQELYERQEDICFAKQHGTALICSSCPQQNHYFQDQVILILACGIEGQV
jgi:hypothetical protein